MKISRTSWAYRLAFFLDEEKPTQVGICQMFWRLLFVPLVPIVLVLSFLVTGLQYAFGFLIGCKPDGYEVDGRGEPYLTWTTYSWWPRFHGWAVRPIYFLVIYGVYLGGREVWFAILVNGALCAFAIGGLFLLAYLSDKPWKNNSVYQVAVGYYRAKKANFCPVITVE